MEAYLKYSMYLVASLITTLVGGVVASHIGGIHIGASFVMSFALLIGFILSKGIIRRIVFYIFSFGEGLFMGSILLQYTGVDLGLCMIITVVTTIVFIAIGLLVKNMNKWCAPLFSALIALLMYEILSVVFPLPGMALGGIILFCAYIAYDINSFKLRVNEGTQIDSDDILDYVMDVYLVM